MRFNAENDLSAEQLLAGIIKLRTFRLQYLCIENFLNFIFNDKLLHFNFQV